MNGKMKKKLQAADTLRDRSQFEKDAIREILETQALRKRFGPTPAKHDYRFIKNTVVCDDETAIPA